MQGFLRCLFAPSIVALCCRLFRASRWDGISIPPHLHDEVPLVFRAPPDFRPPAWVALMGRAAVCAGGRRPGPAAASGRGLVRVCLLWPDVAHRHRGQALSIAQDSHRVVTSHIPEPTPNFACNSPTTLSNLEITSLELRRFQASLKLHPIELHASLLGSGFVAARGVVV